MSLLRTHARTPLIFLGALLLAQPAFAGDGIWTYRGPDGGFVRNLETHPTLSGRAFAHEGDGLFRTSDAGVSWQRVETGLPPGLFLGPVAIADTADVVYVTAENQVLRSTDGGTTWAPTPTAPAGLTFAFAMDIAPGDPDHVAISSFNRVWTSVDAGATWFAAPPFASDVSLNSIEFGSGGVLIAGLQFPSTAYPDAVILRSSDGGMSWTPGSPITSVQSAEVLRSSPADPDRLWMTGFGLLATSADGGLTGVRIDVPVSCNSARSVEPMTTPATGIFVACSTGGLIRSDDATVPMPVWTAIGAAENFVNAGTEPAIANIMAVDAAYPATARLYAGVGSGILRSDSNGSSWLRADSGLQEQRVRAIALHPSDNRVALIGTSDGGNNGLPVYSTIDAGATWSDSINGMTTDWVRSIAIDPTTTDNNPATFEPFTVYAAGRTIARVSSADRDASLMKSTDGGASWTPINNGIATFTSGAGTFTNMGTVRSLVLDPRSCAVPPPGTAPCVPGSGPLQRLWAAGTGVVDFLTGSFTAARVYRSDDAGANWVASESGLPAGIVSGGFVTQYSFVVPLVVNPLNPAVLYLGTGVSNSETTDPTLDNGVFKSIDGGLNWVHSSNGLPRYGGPGTSHRDVLTLAITPSNPDVLYASVNDLVTGMPTASIYKSIDGGASWSNASTGIGGADVRALLVDPADPTGNTVYAGLGGGSAADPGSVYRSLDAGASWNAYSLGLPTGSALSLALESRLPTDRATLIAGTGAGVWEFTVPVDPDSDAVDAAAEAMVNGGDGNGDSIPDAQQSATASFTAATSTRSGNTTAGVSSSVPITIDIVSGCTQLNNATRYEADQYPPDTQYPNINHADYGLIRVELPGCSNAVVDVTFHGASFDPLQWAWRNYGPRVPGDATTFGWYGFAGAQQVAVDTWRLTLDVNAAGNYRGDGQNILLLGGPSGFPQRVFADGFE